MLHIVPGHKRGQLTAGHTFMHRPGVSLLLNDAKNRETLRSKQQARSSAGKGVHLMCLECIDLLRRWRDEFIPRRPR